MGDAWERLAGGEDSVVFAQGGSVVKIVPPFLVADAEREVSVLPRLNLPVPSPRVEDVRREEGWTAVRMTRLPGVSADRVWREVGRADRVRILSAVGSVLRAIGRTPASDADGDASELLARLRARAGRHAARGFGDPAGFVAQSLPDPLPPPALIHFDLNDGNLLLERSGDRWQVSGVLDFVVARRFHAPMDVVTPALFLCRGDRGLLRTLIEHAGAGDLDDAQLAAWHVLHPFSDLPRDLAMAGRAGEPVTEASLRDLWRA